MIGREAGSKTAIFHGLKLGEVVTTTRPGGFGVETVECKNLSFTVERRRPGQDSPPVASFLPGYERSDLMIEDEMHDAVVLAFANTLTYSIATRLGEKMTDVRINEDLWWWHADGAGGDSAFTGGKVQAPAFGVWMWAC